MTRSLTEPLTVDDVRAAHQCIAGVVARTPCPASLALSELTGFEVFCKLDYLQRTGSFKERGVAHALARLADDRRERGVVAASAGNHALAMAYHGRRLGIPVTVVMPRHAPLIKVATCRRFGAHVVSAGASFAEARQHADLLVAERGLTYLHGFDDPHVIAGQGTLGLEVLEQLPDAQAIVVPVGGGGLIAGIATVVRALRPKMQIIAVEPARSASFQAALTAARPVAVQGGPTLADGLAVGQVGELAFAQARDRVDRVVAVDERQLALAVLRLLELEKSVVEGAGAAPLAALLSGELEDLKGQSIVLPLCGGNIDPLTLRRVIEHGLAADQRLHRLEVFISDRPGGLAQLTEVVATCGASVQEIRHDRIFAGPDVAQVRVDAVLETRNAEHFQTVLEELANQGLHASAKTKG